MEKAFIGNLQGGIWGARHRADRTSPMKEKNYYLPEKRRTS